MERKIGELRGDTKKNLKFANYANALGRALLTKGYPEAAVVPLEEAAVRLKRIPKKVRLRDDIVEFSMNLNSNLGRALKGAGNCAQASKRLKAAQTLGHDSDKHLKGKMHGQRIWSNQNY